MFCSGCGNPLKDGARFCEFCGAPVDDARASLGTGASGSPFDAKPSPFDTLGGLNSGTSFREEQDEEARRRVGSDFMWLNFASVFLCCFFPTTLVAVGFSIGARFAKGRYDWPTAGSRSAVARTLFWINLVFAVISYGFLGVTSMLPSTDTDGSSVIERLDGAFEDAWRDAEIDDSSKDAAEQDDSANVDDSK